jgi:hypothetical protein
MVIFITKNLSAPTSEIQLDILRQMHDRSVSNKRELSFQLKVISDRLPIDSLKSSGYVDHNPINYYVIVVDDFNKVVTAMKYISSAYAFNPTGKYLILFNDPERRNSSHEMALDVLNFMLIGHHSANVIFAYAVDMMDYAVYSGDPYHGSKTDCGTMKTLKIGVCKDGTFEQANLARTLIRLPKVPSQMDGCTFKFCARIAEPFINEGCQTGMEVEIMKLLQQSMKFEVRFSKGKKNCQKIIIIYLRWIQSAKLPSEVR